VSVVTNLQIFLSHSDQKLRIEKGGLSEFQLPLLLCLKSGRWEWGRIFFSKCVLFTYNNRNRPLVVCRSGYVDSRHPRADHQQDGLLS